jgi:hypothetical protein
MSSESPDSSRVLDESAGVATEKARQELSAEQEQDGDPAEPLPPELRSRPYEWSLHESEYLLTNLDELAGTIPKENGDGAIAATRDPPDSELTHGHDFWRDLKPDDDEPELGAEPDTDTGDAQQARLHEWDRLDTVVELRTKALKLQEPIIFAPDREPSVRGRVRIRLLLRRLLTHALKIKPNNTLLLAVVRFLMERRREQQIHDILNHRAQTPDAHQSVAQAELRLAKSHSRLARRLTLACARLQPVQIGPIEEQTAAAALRSLCQLLEEQLPAHFGLGQFLETASEVALRGGVGQDYLAFAVELCLTPNGPYNAAIRPEYVAAIREEAVEVHQVPLCRWLQGLFADWRKEKLHNRLKLEMDLLKQADKRRRRAAAKKQKSESDAKPRSHEGRSAPTGEPPDAPLPALLSAPDLARITGFSQDAVDSFLRRYRRDYPDCYVENESPRKTDPHYLYRTADVLPALEGRVKRSPVTDE